LSDAVSVIVQGVSSLAAGHAVADHGGKVVADLSIVDGVEATIPASSVPSLRADSRVRDVTPNNAVHTQGGLSTPHDASGVFPKVVGADRVWADGFDGAGVTVAVVDTGIQANVPDLAGRVVGGVDFSGEGDPFKDSFGHGTFVSGLIAGNGASSGGQYKGIAPAANLVSVKIAGASGASDIAHVLAAMQWLVSFKNQYGIRVANLSFGTDSAQHYYLSLLNMAVERAWDAGIVVVVSASNLGSAPGSITKPADDPLVITVGASDDRGTVGRGDDVIAGFSGVGPTAADGLEKPDLVAPGRSVVSLRAPGSYVDQQAPSARIGTAYFRGSGTSFSTGITSGAAALLLDSDPSLNPNQVKQRLLSTAAPAPVSDPNVAGRGALDVYAATQSTDIAEANQNVMRSVGSGALEADRGNFHVYAKTLTTTLLGNLVTTLTRLTGTLLPNLQTFDANQYVSSAWTAANWTTSQWTGANFRLVEGDDTTPTGSQWWGSQWWGSQWWGSQWWGSQWWMASTYAAVWA
jgi:serine protease AprX